jgi:2-dehydro-3-deoxyphosphogluconate aldolase / (4S)-4-hydroxy-2-oxoglutarate aldolase
MLNQIKESGLIAIIRGKNPKDIVSIVSALKDGGAKAVEVTMDTPNVLEVLEQLNAEFGHEMLIGAGTVLDPESARMAIMAGAKFIISPSLNVDTIRMTKRYGALSIPGVFTPTEALTAYEAGADAVKVFPIHVLGPAYLKAIRDPLPQIPLIPTGGINLENVKEYLKLGVVAVGLGGALIHKCDEVNEVYLREVKDNTEQFVKVVKEVRS